MWLILLIIFVALLIIGISTALYSTRRVKLTEIDIVNERIPKAFDGKKIVHISDLQNSYFSGFYEQIYSLIQKENPEYILFTGDLIDRRKYHLDRAERFISKLVKIAPVVFVSGNHEAWCGKYDEVAAMLDKYEVKRLEDEQLSWQIDDGKINIIGVRDPGFMGSYQMNDDEQNQFQSIITALCNDDYSILLTHRPELLSIYAECNVDLVLCGHAHGGQFRLPLIGPLYAPHQGLFPKYTDGVHVDKNSTEIINRGLGNGKMQFRTFNNPEVISITLHTK